MLKTLDEFQRSRKLKDADLPALLSNQGILLYYKCPGNMRVYVADGKFLKILSRPHTRFELKVHLSGSGSKYSERASDISWLQVTPGDLQRILQNGCTSRLDFAAGLRLTAEGFETATPEYVLPEPFFTPTWGQLVYYVATQPVSEKIHPATVIERKSLYVLQRDARPVHTIASTSLSADVLPRYDYASCKLEIALNVWNATWRKDFKSINDKDRVTRKKIDEIHHKAIRMASAELRKLYSSPGYAGEEYKNLEITIAKLIRPEFAPKDCESHWFREPISSGIRAMIDASNQYWGDVEMRNDTEGKRLEIIEYMTHVFGFNRSLAAEATRIIQPESITRGQTKQR